MHDALVAVGPAAFQPIFLVGAAAAALALTPSTRRSSGGGPASRPEVDVHDREVSGR